MVAIRPKVLLMGPLPYVKDIFYDKVSPLADVVECTSTTYDELEADFKGKYAGTVAIYHFRNPGGPFGYFDEEFFKRMPESCKIISHLGAGYDDIDVAAAKRYGITVTNTPGAVDDATATVAVYLIISAMRQFAKAEIACRNLEWKKNLPLARDPEYKTIGIVGMGGIGTVTARRMALGWGMKVIYHNRKRLAQEPTDFQVEYKETLEELLKEADVVSLHIPMSAKTRHMFSKAQFDTMKKGSILVNTARGGLIDEDALVEAVESGKLHGVGVDVYPDEPKINPKLFDHPSITLLPHMGTETWDSRNKMALMVVDNIMAGLKGETLPNVIPEHQ